MSHSFIRICATGFATAGMLAFSPMPALAAETPTDKSTSSSEALPAPAASAATPRLFAIEIQTGPGWDTAKPPQAQAHFKEHSAHLKQLRDAGRIRAGARYGDKGLVVVVAADEAEARSWIEADPSMRAGTFRYTLNEMRVFYPGMLEAPKKP